MDKKIIILEFEKNLIRLYKECGIYNKIKKNLTNEEIKNTCRELFFGGAITSFFTYDVGLSTTEKKALYGPLKLLYQKYWTWYLSDFFKRRKCI